MDETEARQKLSQMTSGSSTIQAIFAAAELGIADLIAAGTKDLADLATATGCAPAALYRFMRYLVSIDIFGLTDGAYELTPMGQLLRSETVGSRRASARITGRFLPAWSEILHSLKTGESGFAKIYGMGLFDHFSANPEEAAIFDTVMTEVHGPESAAICAAYDFGSFKCLTDVGGGNGTLMMEILEHFPTLKGIVFDRPDVAGRTEKQIAEAGYARQCQTVGGNFFEAVPEGSDGLILRHVLHDWYDADCVGILTNCRKALPEEGRILVAEMIVEDDNEPSIAKQFDLSMLVLAGGMERTLGEYEALFDKAGFSLTQVVATTSPTSLIEGKINS